MKLRKLKQKDAEFMLEWMHDSFVTKYLKTDFSAKTLEDCKQFIVTAQDTSRDLHLAIVNDEDEYMGTVSLKHITKENAEFAIAIRKCSMGRGYSRYGIKGIIKIAFDDLKLKVVYWCVDPANKRAIRFYEKYGYHKINYGEDAFSKSVIDDFAYTGKQIHNYIWYSINK